MGYIGAECSYCGNVSQFTFICIGTSEIKVTFDSRGEVSKLESSNQRRQVAVHVHCARCGYEAPPPFFGLAEPSNVHINVDDRNNYMREANLHNSGCKFVAVRTYFKDSQEASIAIDLAKIRCITDIEELPEFMTSESPVIRMVAKKKFDQLYRLTQQSIFVPKARPEEGGGWSYGV